MTSLATDFVRNFLCFDDFWPNAASAKSSHQEFADSLVWVISAIAEACHVYAKTRMRVATNCKSSKFEAGFFPSL